MTWRNIKIIFKREVCDQIRDRRTLFMVVMLPLLLYPGLAMSMVYMQTLFTEQPRTVVILGTEHLPPQPPLLDDDGRRFHSRWFESPGEAEKLEVVADRPAGHVGDSRNGAGPPPSRRLLDRARDIRKLVEERQRLVRALKRARRQNDERRVARLHADVERLSDEMSRNFGRSEFQVLIIVPDGFAEEIEHMTASDPRRPSGNESPGLITVQNTAVEESQIAYRRVSKVLDAWWNQVRLQGLVKHHLPESFLSPAVPQSVDLAQDEQIAANFWSKLFPALLVIMTITGAFYPAVDVAAGEKERGTMETLLICPATRSEIVLGKFFTVMVFSIATAVLNLLSMGLTGAFVLSSVGNEAVAGIGDVALPPPAALLWMAVLLLPLAGLFSAVCLSLATFARSSKEGQYYLWPVLMLTLGLTVFCLYPAVEITPFYSIMPVVGPALLLKKLLVSPGGTEGLLYAIPVLVTSVGYSLLALWWAIEQFNREDVLFREAERFELRLWIRHLLRDKEPTPSFTEAGFCFVLIIFLQFAALKVFQPLLDQPGQAITGALLMKLLMIQQLVMIATPALLMGVMLTTSLARTFRLHVPNWRMFAVAAALPILLHPLSIELSAVLQDSFFPPRPPRFDRILQTIGDPAESLWLVLLAFALVPAVCEELAFRGFLLSGFARSGRVWLAVGLSSLAFGIMHMIPQQVFNATLLGVVLGLLAVRANSLWPCFLFHVTYNGLEVCRGRLTSWITVPHDGWFIALGEQGTVRYPWPTLIVAAVLALVLIRWLVLHGSKRRAAPAAAPETDADRVLQRV